MALERGDTRRPMQRQMVFWPGQVRFSRVRRRRPVPRQSPVTREAPDPIPTPPGSWPLQDARATPPPCGRTSRGPLEEAAGRRHPERRLLRRGAALPALRPPPRRVHRRLGALRGRRPHRPLRPPPVARVAPQRRRHRALLRPGADRGATRPALGAGGGRGRRRFAAGLRGGPGYSELQRTPKSLSGGPILSAT